MSVLDAEIRNLTANMLSGVVSPLVARMLADREAETERLRGTVRPVIAPGPTIPPHPVLRKRFEERVASLRASLSDTENRPEVAKVLGELIQQIVIHPEQSN